MTWEGNMWRKMITFDTACFKHIAGRHSVPFNDPCLRQCFITTNNPLNSMAKKLLGNFLAKCLDQPKFSDFYRQNVLYIPVLIKYFIRTELLLFMYGLTS